MIEYEFFGQMCPNFSCILATDNSVLSEGQLNNTNGGVFLVWGEVYRRYKRDPPEEHVFASYIIITKDHILIT